MLNYQDKIDAKVDEKKLGKEEQQNKKLKTVYREASKLFHPDVNKSKEAERIMKQVNHFHEKKDYHAIKNLIEKSIHTI